ncbi:MAG: hypothetical protein EKK54_09155 [Neisseriaceae bacterium]|nr:MAG: hypothetical protein EKK54_09155 [Neisseriaceae bacterium]
MNKVKLITAILFTVISINNISYATQSQIVAGEQNAPAISKDFAVKSGGIMKIASVLFPGFKPYSDFASGYFDAAIGQPSTAAQMTEILNRLDMINNQVTNISNTLADFRDDYNSDQKYLNDAIMHKKYLLINTDATSWKNLYGNGSIDDFVDAQGGETAWSGQKLAALQNLLQNSFDGEIIEAVETISNQDNLNKTRELLQRLQNKKSTASNKINYIALRTYYNQQLISYFSNIMLQLNQAMTLQKQVIFLTSSDSKSKYRSHYVGNVKFGIKGINQNNTYAQNIAALQNYYNPKFERVLEAFDKKNFKNIYQDTGLEFVDEKESSSLTSFKQIYKVDYYDGFHFKGSFYDYLTNQNIDFTIAENYNDKLDRFKDYTLIDKKVGFARQTNYSENMNFLRFAYLDATGKKIYTPYQAYLLLIGPSIWIQTVTGFGAIGSREFNDGHRIAAGSLSTKIKTEYRVRGSLRNDYQISLIKNYDLENKYPSNNFEVVKEGDQKSINIYYVKDTSHCNDGDCGQYYRTNDHRYNGKKPAIGIYKLNKVVYGREDTRVPQFNEADYLFGFVYGSYSIWKEGTFPSIGLSCVTPNCKEIVENYVKTLVYTDGTKIKLRDSDGRQDGPGVEGVLEIYGR